MHADKSRRLAVEMSVAAVRLVRWLRAADDAPALSGPEASALAVVIHSDGVSPSALAQLEQVRRPTMTRVINALVARGLVARAAHPTDGRAVILCPTERGRALWMAGQLRRVAPLAERIAELSQAEAELIEGVVPLLLRLSAPPARA